MGKLKLHYTARILICLDRYNSHVAVGQEPRWVVETRQQLRCSAIKHGAGLDW